LSPGPARVIPFSDPLLAPLTGFGGTGGLNFGTSPGGAGPGGGGAGASNSGGNVTPGGFGGGGGGRNSSGTLNGVQTGGALGGGGAGGYGPIGSLAGGGAGGLTFGTMLGGPATVWIFY
jgi:hypothetical protein